MPCDESLFVVEIANSPIINANERSQIETIANRRKDRRDMQPEIVYTTTKSHRYGPSSPGTNDNMTRNVSGSTSTSSSSSFDPIRRNDSANSSSSLILILERPEDQETKNEDFSVDRGSSVGLTVGRVTTSSIENLARKKGTTRCRRKRSTASPRNTRNATTGSASESTDFVATSTLTKNRDCSASISLNASRSAGKFKLPSSTDSLRNHLDGPRREIQNIGTQQQSTISVAAIRATNFPLACSRDNKNEAIARTGSNVASKIRSNLSYASAPSLNNYNVIGRRDSANNNSDNSHNDSSKNNNDNIMINNINNNNNNNIKKDRATCRELSSHSTSSRSSSVIPLASSLASYQRVSAKSKKNKRTTLTTAVSSPVTTSYAPLAGNTDDLSTEKTTFIPRVDSAISLKSSSSFASARLMKKNRGSRVITSLHASLGQLPIASSCATSATTIGDGTSLENLQTLLIPAAPESNKNESYAAKKFYTNSSSSQAHGFSSRVKTSPEIPTPTISGTFGISPRKIAPPQPEGPNFSSNVAPNNIHKNSNLPTSNINNNPRCNHMSGTCSTCSVTASQTSSPLTRTPNNVVNGPATTSAWAKNSPEQETDYVVDPVQGNAYHKGQFLGKGGFARVYLMTDVANGNQYACKIIPKNRMQKIHIQKIAREIMIHKELNHVNVVQMHHYFEDNINVYMLLEPCPRKSLMHVLKYRGKVTEPEARYYMRQMVTGVAYIHSQKVVHRDLKPGNMFLSDGMIVKIGDFGLATRPDGQRRRVTVCGTPNYIAPEVLYKQAYSYEADVWALGCILYALLAGQPPFDTSTLKETYARICNNRYKKLDDSIVSRSGQDLIRWLLQPIPELRPSLERVKEHAYLTMEYVPTKLSHTCCYRIPIAHSIANEQSPSRTPGQIGLANSMIPPRGLATTNEERNKREPGNAVATLLPKNLHQTSTICQAQVDVKIGGIAKKSKVGNWLLRKLPKLPRFRQRFNRLLCLNDKKTDGLMMHRAIEACLAEIRCTRSQDNPMLVDGISPLFVTKWIDYSNKYGLGFQLSDRSVGVLFNDSTKMSYTHDRRVEYATTEDKVTRYRRENDVPSCMEEKLELLRHFTHYMDNFLTNGGEVKEQRTTKFSWTNSTNVPRMRRWLRTDKAIVMELTVPLLQVNFFVDHSKIVVSEGNRGRGFLVTYIDASRQASSYWLNDLRDIGCTAELYERLHYVSKVIAELENHAILESVTTVSQNRKTLRT